VRAFKKNLLYEVIRVSYRRGVIRKELLLRDFVSMIFVMEL